MTKDDGTPLDPSFTEHNLQKLCFVLFLTLTKMIQAQVNTEGVECRNAKLVKKGEDEDWPRV